MIERALPVALQDLLKRDIRLPVCPIVFVRLNDALDHPKAAVRNLVDILSSDPHLATQVLRVANSAQYGLARQVRGVSEAILRIGFRDVWSIACAVKAKELFQTADGQWSQLSTFLWEHALATGVIAKHISRKLSMGEGETVFTAALLHDLGKSVLYQFDPQYGLLCRNGALYGRQLTLRENDFFGTHHARFGSELLRHWNLPETVASLVEHHHDEPVPDDELKEARIVLTLANQTAHTLVPAPYEKPLAAAQLPDYLIDDLKLEIEAFVDLVDDAKKEFVAMQQF